MYRRSAREVSPPTVVAWSDPTIGLVVAPFAGAMASLLVVDALRMASAGSAEEIAVALSVGALVAAVVVAAVSRATRVAVVVDDAAGELRIERPALGARGTRSVSLARPLSATEVRYAPHEVLARTHRVVVWLRDEHGGLLEPIAFAGGPIASTAGLVARLNRALADRARERAA